MIMKKVLLIAVFLITGISLSFSQKTITVQSNGVATFHTEWASAWAATQAGDTIYLPGGTFNIGNLVINRRVTIIGVGHDPTQTHDGLFSHLNGSIFFVEGSDESLLHGFQFTNLYFNTTSWVNQAVSNVNISRCRITNSTQIGYTKPSLAQHILFKENVFGGAIYGRDAQQIQFVKNIIDERVYEFNGYAVFTNNVFSYYYASSAAWAPLQQMRNVLVQNNIFRTTAYPLNNSENNLLQNNIIVANLTINPQTDLNTWIGNFFNQPLAEVFVSFTSGAFIPEHDYHLLPTSVGVGAGTDGYDIGIYGTAVPYKEGAVPFNPQIIFEQVSGQTDDEGNIEVQVNVSAQER
jgi:hypothetical protein